MADEVESGAAADEGAGSPPASDVEDGSGAGSPPATESEAGSPPASASTEDEPEELKNALAKHGGSKAALARHYWQTQQDNARLAKELEDERSKRSTPAAGQTRAEKEPEPAPVDLAPELKELETYLGSLEEESKALPTLQAQRLSRVAKAREDVIRANTRLEMADEMDKPSWEQKVRLAELHENEAKRAYAESHDRQRQLENEINRAKRERQGLKRHLDSERERQEQASQKHSEFMESFPAQVDGYITRSLDEFNVPKDEKLRNNLWESANEALTTQFWRMKAVPVDQVDVPALVKKTVEKILQRHDLAGRQKFAQVSTGKLAVSKPAAPRQAPSAPAARDPKAPVMPYEAEDPHPALTAARKRLAGKGL